MCAALALGGPYSAARYFPGEALSGVLVLVPLLLLPVPLLVPVPVLVPLLLLPVPLLVPVPDRSELVLVPLPERSELLLEPVLLG
jgi:hypothetical protein